MDKASWVLLIVFLILFIICGYLAHQKKRSIVGFLLLSILLTPFMGIIILALIPPKKNKTVSINTSFPAEVISTSGPETIQEVTDPKKEKSRPMSFKISFENYSTKRERPMNEEESLNARYNAEAYDKKRMNELQGMSAAMIYDNKIDDSEIRELLEWRDKNPEFSTRWPFSLISPILEDINENGKANNAQREMLLKILKAFAADPQEGHVVEGIFDDDVIITFPQKRFVFTGRLQMGERAETIKAVENKGGIGLKNLSVLTDYLIVGELGNDESWKFSRYGAKIERAMQLKGQTEIKIIREKHFVAALSK